MIPTVDDLASSPLVHRFGEIFNPPGLTNFLGCVQADNELMGIRSTNFPPFGCGDVITAGLYLDGVYFPATGAPVTFVWTPDRIVRTADHDGLRLRTTTVLARDAMAAIIVLEIQNVSGVDRDIDVRVGIRGAVTRQDSAWISAMAPIEFAHDTEIDPSRNAVIFRARASAAASVQGAHPAPEVATPDALRWRVHLNAGARWEVAYVNALGGDAREALATFDRFVKDAHNEIDAVRAHWNDELHAVFTPGNDRYGGSLPVLETDDADVLRAYHLGMMGVVYFKRDNPHSVIGRSYDTLMPRYWPSVTFLWDYSLSGVVHAQLDPQVMRRHLELWMSTDIHTCVGTEWLTGGPVGAWYSVNDYAMTQMIRDYVRWTGDRAWLDAEVPSLDGKPKAVRAHLNDYAMNWERFRQPSGLADYGGINNLLECVSTYVHQIAALNAGNVQSLRVAAEVAELGGDPAAAKTMRTTATDLVARIQDLYADGRGFWHSRYPDGSLVEVRHCYDFITVLATIAGDLTQQQRDEMAAFLFRELKTETWMHALSCDDPDAMFSVRPDHQWTGAYPAWPPLSVAGLYTIGRVDEGFAWLKGLARSANQGPYGQAHFAESVVEPDAGGARKAPPDFPYITDWTVSSGGAWCNVIIESIFGVRAGLDGTITATPQFGPFDPDARLRGLSYQGKRYDVVRDGIHPA